MDDEFLDSLGERIIKFTNEKFAEHLNDEISLKNAIKLSALITSEMLKAYHKEISEVPRKND